MSKEVISGLGPKTLWRRFYEISRIPRPSGKEEKILQYLRDIANELKHEVKQDSAGNMLILVPPTPGNESSKTVVLQSHVDMVCEKNKDSAHDFDNDPIKMLKNDGWIKADDTTLGSDNGIGIAASLAVAGDKDVIHGPLELLFTVTEETGLLGASNLKQGFISGKILLNLDAEEEGSFYVGCAGGVDTIGTFEIERMNPSSGLIAHDLVISGLKGGHSGLDIHEGRANAVKLLGRLLKKLDGIDYQIARITGGSKRNSIPREAEATILLNPSDTGAVRNIINEFLEEALKEYRKNDGGLKIEFDQKDKCFDIVFKGDFVTKIIDVILALPHGIIAMSPDIPNLVETSTNLATIVMEADEIKVETSQRSSIESAKAYVVGSVESLFRLAGARILMENDYSGWKPNLNSKILGISKQVYRKLFAKEPEIKAIHAGLECGIIGEKHPGLDMISFGPTIKDAHSPNERVNIDDVRKFYDLLKGMLLELAKLKE